MIEILDIKDAEPNKSNWIPISDMPNCCGYPVLLTVENKFGQRGVCYYTMLEKYIQNCQQ